MKRSKDKPQAVRDLEKALQAERVRTHPQFAAHIAKTGFPITHYIPVPTRDDSTANGLTKCIIEFIRLNGGQAERISITGRPMNTPSGLKWGATHMTRGTADISATIQGRSVKIEVKAGRDTQSVKQKEYQASIERAGGLYYVARNFTDFVAWYKLKFGGLNNGRT